MSKTIYIDIDHTIWDLYDDLKVAAKELYDFDLKREHIDRWNWCYRLFGDDGFRIFHHVLVPEKVAEREMYEGVADAMNSLHDMGYNLYFLSHHWKPSVMEPAVREWLHSELSVPMTVKLMPASNSKVEYMLEDRTACGIIEDKNKTLEEAVQFGVPAIAKVQNWNRDIIEKLNINYIDNWAEGSAELIDETMYKVWSPEGTRVLPQTTLF